MAGAWLTSETVQVKVLLFERAPSDAVAVTVWVPALVKVSVPEIRPVLALTLERGRQTGGAVGQCVPSGSLAASWSDDDEPSALCLIRRLGHRGRLVRDCRLRSRR